VTINIDEIRENQSSRFLRMPKFIASSLSVIPGLTWCDMGVDLHFINKLHKSNIRMMIIRRVGTMVFYVPE